MDWVIKIGQLLLSLSILVLLHEWGHYITARMFKTRVEKFYLFFDFLFPLPNVAKFSLFKIKIGDTEWGLGWFPLGGYVKIAGMMDESDDKEAMKQPPKPDEFRSKKAWQRLIIILGGIIVNLILGILIFWMTKFIWGDTYIPLKKTEIAVTDSTMIKAGFLTGDKVIGYESSGDVMSAILFDDVRKITVERNGGPLEITLPEAIIHDIIKNGDKEAFFAPRIPFVVADMPDSSININSGLMKQDRIIMLDSMPIQYVDQFKAISEQYKGKTVPAVVERKLESGEVKNISMNLQVGPEGLLEVSLPDIKDLNKIGLMPLEIKKYGFFEALPAGFNTAVEILTKNVKQFKLIFRPSTGAYKKVSGFAGMAKMFPNEWSWESFWKLTGMLSLVLAFMNFLPIPMLDGGYMMFILWEMITGKPPGEKFMTIANNIGFVIVIGLLLYANGGDIIRGIFGN